MIAALASLALAVIIIVRCVCVAMGVSGANFKAQHGGLRWHGFVASYVVLCGAALFAVLEIARTGGGLALWFFLVASAGLILFDPRRGK